MPDQDDDLPFGLYERLITTGLKARILRFDPKSTRVVTGDLDAAEAQATLARHVEAVVARALKDLPEEQRVAVTNQLIGLLVAANNPPGAGLRDDLVASPTALLRAIHAVTGAPTDDRDIVAPLVPLSASDLLVNSRGEPALAHEIPSADAIDLLCAFVRWHGLRLLEDELVAHGHWSVLGVMN